MAKPEITIQDIQRITDAFNTAREADKGFILLPSVEGFEVYEVDKERLKAYLQIEGSNLFPTFNRERDGR